MKCIHCGKPEGLHSPKDKLCVFGFEYSKNLHFTPMKTYKQDVTRTEEFTISEAELNQERQFQLGRSDRKAGKPCASANGAYLNGWYSPDTEHYYIPAAAAHLL